MLLHQFQALPPTLRPAGCGRDMDAREKARQWGRQGAEEKKKTKKQRIEDTCAAEVAAGRRGKPGGQLTLSFGTTMSLSGRAGGGRSGALAPAGPCAVLPLRLGFAPAAEGWA
jgi:hypothetical protein